MTVTANKLASPVPIFPFQTYFAHYKKTTLVLVSAGGVSIEISVILDDYERRKRAGVGGYLVTLSVRGYFFYVTGLSVRCLALNLKVASFGMKIKARSVGNT